MSEPGSGGTTFDRHLVLDQLGGWRGMVDASLPTIAFIVANSVGGLTVGIWAALASAVLVFLLRLLRRESLQQAVSGLFAVGVAVAIAAYSGQARDFFVLGIVRNAGIALILLASIPFRRPLVGVIAEFLAPSHLGALSTHRLPSLRDRVRRDPAATVPMEGAAAVPVEGGATVPVAAGERAPDPEPEQHWREDPRMLRAYGWLTVLWAAVFALRAVVQGVFYLRDEVELLATSSLVLGLPLTAAELVVTLWVVARLHRHRSAEQPPAS
ncbi:DUF3159 domain-containing protein [Modestobacter marinus]|uniref:Membrane protein n=1 Tax=Modestobacter marinus TaxID=477641 RepID=A0A846LLR7_9ACTN|nr:DUF3159 domain-containing protein [Modestobacter marinus]NIH68427.1 hypothetical protein [Modestobacter marinus]GGL57122.1 membrane protein [Modestobacter marinus]